MLQYWCVCPSFACTNLAQKHRKDPKSADDWSSACGVFSRGQAEDVVRQRKAAERRSAAVAGRPKRKRGHKTWAGFQRKDDWNKTREAFRLCSARAGAKAASTTTPQAPWLTDERAVQEHAFFVQSA